VELNTLQWNFLASGLLLSSRQGEVLQGICDDLKEGAIAMRLGISEHTVHTHCARLYRKLGVHDRTSLLMRVWEESAAITREALARNDPVQPSPIIEIKSAAMPRPQRLASERIGASVKAKRDG
jgi:DNA-binding CsgD family transcriptional regulator